MRKSINTFSILESKSSIAGKTCSSILVISFAKYINIFALTSIKVISVETFYALILIIIGITVLNLKFSFYFRYFTCTIEQ